MHQVLPETREDLIALRISGELDETDFATIIPMLEARIVQRGKLRLLWETCDFVGLSANGFGSEFNFEARHAEDFSRIATVGEAHRKQVLLELMKPFASADIRHFLPQDRHTAVVWLQARA